MNKTGKVWGWTGAAMVSPGLEIHRLSVKPNAWCSRHRHQHKCNAFLVVSGVLHVTIEKDYGLSDETELRAGEMTVVEPGLFHKFRTGPEGAELFEIYYPAPLVSEDIERTGTGGSAEHDSEVQAADAVSWYPESNSWRSVIQLNWPVDGSGAVGGGGAQG